MRLFSTLSRTLREFLQFRSPMIHCIGDSHASFFSGRAKMQPEWPGRSDDVFPFFRSYRLGPTLAYNLCRAGTASHGREKLFEVLLRKVSPGERVLLCFGEIDCRAHLISRTRISGRLAEDLAEECVARYFRVVDEISSMGFRPMIWNVVPPTTLNIDEWAFPVEGSFNERMAVTRHFNGFLRQRCDQAGLPFVSVFEGLLDTGGLPDHRFFLDQVHLGPNALSLVIEALRPICPEIDFGSFQQRIAA